MASGKNYGIYFSSKVAELLEFEAQKKGVSPGAWIKQLVEKQLGLELSAEEIAEMKSKLAQLENEQRRMRYESIRSDAQPKNLEVISDYALIGTHLKKVDQLVA